jgi:hypothetical protein
MSLTVMARMDRCCPVNIFKINIFNSYMAVYQIRETYGHEDKSVSVTCFGLKILRGCIQKFPDWGDNKVNTTTTTTTTTTINTRWKATQRVMATELSRLTHKITIKVHIVAESCIICSSCSRRPVRKLLDTPSYLSCSFCNGRSGCLMSSILLTWYNHFCIYCANFFSTEYNLNYSKISSFRLWSHK